MPKKILLADDSITIQKVIELTFSDEDFEVVTVGNGRLAIERLPEARPDLVLCDIIMPEKDGYEVCDFIKKSPELAHIPVLLLTGAFEPFDQERAARVGCDGFLAKPFEPQTLIAKVKDLLAKAPARPAAAPVAVPAPAPAPAPSPVPPAYDRGTGFDAPAAERASPPTPSAPSWASPAPAPEAPEPAAPEPELPMMEPESFASDATGAADDVGTVKSPPYRPEDGRFGGKPPSSLDDLYDDDSYGAAPDLMPLTDEETASVSGTAAPEEDEGAAPAPWAQPTVEVPLEDRAQAGADSAAEAAEGGFEEVFDERTAASREAAAAPAPAPSAPAAPESSFRDIAPPAEEPAAAKSIAGEVSVPVDMVEKIAQRVVAQLSEKVIREIAWEVIPDLAEALIRKEIDRLKAELQQT